MSQVGPSDAVTNLGKWWELTGWAAPTWLLAPSVDKVAFYVSLIVLLWAVWYFWIRRETTTFIPGHETDASDVFRYLLNDTVWSEREHRRLNFRAFLNHLHEFRRAARDDGLRTTGIPTSGGRPEPIDSRHWDGAQIDPDTIGARGRVCSKSIARYPMQRHEYAAIKVRTEDVYRIWPTASSWARILTKGFVRLKMIYYLLTPDAWAVRWHRWNTIRDNVREGRATPKNVNESDPPLAFEIRKPIPLNQAHPRPRSGAYVAFTVNGLLTIKESYNITSVTDAGYNLFVINFDEPFASDKLICTPVGATPRNFTIHELTASRMTIELAGSNNVAFWIEEAPSPGRLP